MNTPMLGHAPAMLQSLKQIPLRTQIAGKIARSRGIRVTDINVHVTRLFEDEILIMAQTLIGAYKDAEALKRAVMELSKIDKTPTRNQYEGFAIPRCIDDNKDLTDAFADMDEEFPE